MKKIHSVKLEDKEKEHLQRFIRSGQRKAREVRRAHILLLASENRNDEEIATTLRCCKSTVANTRKRFRVGGIEGALQEKPRSGRPEKLGKKEKAHLIALATSDPPEGNAVWTMHLLANKIVELSLVESISDETVRLLLKKVT